MNISKVVGSSLSTTTTWQKKFKRYRPRNKISAWVVLGFLLLLYLISILTAHHHFVKDTSTSSSTSISSSSTKTNFATRTASSNNGTTAISSESQQSLISTIDEMTKINEDIEVATISSNNNGSTYSTNVTATLVIQVRGEMGNNLQKIAHGYGLKWYAQEFLKPSQLVDFQLRISHKKKHGNKAKLAQNDIESCFVNLRNFDNNFLNGNDPQFLKYQKSQTQWLQQQQQQQQQSDVDQATNDIYRIRHSTKEEIELGLQAIRALANNTPSPTNKPFGSGNYGPIIVLDVPMRNILIDKYYNKYRQLFAFHKFVDDDDNDNTGNHEIHLSSRQQQCCAQVPDPDEVVFHFRQFAKELSIEEQKSRGFEELDPTRVANQLMKHLPSGQKVAMTTRFNAKQEPLVELYLKTFKARGFQPRLIVNQTGIQDFCFLLNAQQELLGVAKSTYARWAAYLGRAKSVQLYAIDNVGSKEFIETTMNYPWTNPEIVQRIHWPIFPSL